jgi:hypothetical protein
MSYKLDRIDEYKCPYGNSKPLIYRKNNRCLYLRKFKNV